MMNNQTIRERLDAYTKEKYGIDPEILPFSHEDYEIYRHTDTGKWFAVSHRRQRRMGIKEHVYHEHQTFSGAGF